MKVQQLTPAKSEKKPVIDTESRPVKLGLDFGIMSESQVIKSSLILI